MRKYEFRVIPVPARTERKLAEPGQDPLTATIETALNALAIEGWEYVRSETFSLSRGGWFRRGRVEKPVLVFRRERAVLNEPVADAAEMIERARSRKPRAETAGDQVQPRRIAFQPTAVEAA